VIARAIVAALVFLIALLTYPGALAVSLATRFTPAPATSPGPEGALPWLHVAHPSGDMPYIADDQGRMVLLHGSIPASLLEFGPGTGNAYSIDPAEYADGRCPPNSSSSRYPPLCQADLAAMAALGFNSVRLPISWSLLEPERGRFNTTYLDRVAQLVDWAGALHMYVIVDMHQNAYSHFVAAGTDVDLGTNSGAPGWATITDGLPSRVYQRQRELNPAVLEATTNFWYDRDGIQDEYIAALAYVAKRFRDQPIVAGYGVYNEPLFGWNLPPGFEDLLLFPFYRRVIDAITGVRDGLPCWSGFFMPAVCGYRDLGVDDRRHLLFLEPGLLRQVTDFPTHLGLPISSYPNLVLTLHAYTHVFTIEQLLGQTPRTATYPWGGFDQTYGFAKREARAMAAALFVSEFGNSPADDDLLLTAQVREQELHLTGFAQWPWKENGAGWGMYKPPNSPQDSSGCLRISRERLLARVYPRATSDPHLTFRYDSATGAFTLTAAGRAGDAPTIVYVPAEDRGPIATSGSGTTSVEAGVEGSRTISTVPTGGNFTVSIGPGTLDLKGCP